MSAVVQKDSLYGYEAQDYLDDIEVREYKNFQDLKRCIHAQADCISEQKTFEDHLAFLSVSDEAIEDIDKRRNELGKSTRIIYFSKEHVMILRLGGSRAHESVHLELSFQIRHATTLMGMPSLSIGCAGHQTYFADNGSRNEADSALYPRGVRGNFRDWPSLVIEAGYHESLTRLRRDAGCTGTEVARIFRDQLQGKVILITGANADGLGGTTAKALAAGGPKELIVTARSQAKLDIIKASIASISPNVVVRTIILDLSSQKAVRAVAEEINSWPESINILINNAGIMALPERTLNVDGIEAQSATNHIGHFLFTNLILPKLFAAPGGGRIVNVSSDGHTFGPVRFSDINFDGKNLPDNEKPDYARLAWPNESIVQDFTGYSPWAAYAQSKTANVLFALGLQRRLHIKGLQSYALHPGVIQTELMRNMDAKQDAETRDLIAKNSLVFKTPEEGVSTTVRAALDPSLPKGTLYLQDTQPFEPKDWAAVPEFADRLWELSEKLVGQKFAF